MVQDVSADQDIPEDLSEHEMSEENENYEVIDPQPLPAFKRQVTKSLTVENIKTKAKSYNDDRVNCGSGDSVEMGSTRA